MRIPTTPCADRPTEDQLLRCGAALAGAMLSVGAALAADLARTHAVALGTICGAGLHPHCGWCFGAAGLALAGLAAFAFALRRPSKPSPIAVRPA